MANTTYYLNSDFDLSLRARPGRIANETLARQVRELSTQALLGADPGDAALLRVDVPDDFLSHLGACDLPVPRLLRHPRIDPDSAFRPFGWNAEAIELNGRHRRPSKHPDPDCVRRVNSRSFSAELERSLDPESSSGTVVESVAELESCLSRLNEDSEWVVKADHGNAALGNRRVGRRLTAADRRFVERCFVEDDRLIIEPWLARVRDWCVVCGVPFDATRLRIHETVCTTDGSLIGALFEPVARESPWWDELCGTAEQISAALDREGYFGPACFDAFSWRDGNKERLRALVDLNCRLSMSDAAHRTWQHVGSDRVLYYRFFSRRKLDLPHELPKMIAALGENGYDRLSRRGILPASPLRLGAADEQRQPTKLAVMFVGDDRAAIFELERWFRERFEH